MGKAVPDGVSQALACPLSSYRRAESRQAPRFAIRCSLRGEAVVQLPRASNNADHGSLRLARRVKSFQLNYHFVASQRSMMNR